MLQQVYGDNIMSHIGVFEWYKRFKEGQEEIERWLQVWEAFSKRDWDQRQVGKAVGVWWSLVDFSNDCKLVGHEKGQSLEDYLWRFEHVWKVNELGVLSIHQFLAKSNITLLEVKSLFP